MMRNQINQESFTDNFTKFVKNPYLRKMEKTTDKTLIRDSIVTHLETLESFGVKHVVPPTQTSPPAPQTPDAQPTTHNSQRSPLTEPPTPPGPQAPRPQISESTKDEGRKTTPQTLKELQTSMTNCQLCKLHQGRTNLVFGIGSETADLMFVGEGPGADEDAQGVPFVGRAGQLLTKMIAAMGYQREEVYIANIVKCRPPDNRNPEPEEMTACMPFLKQQIAMIKPKMIVCLGKVATQGLLNTQMAISRIRGNFQEFEGVPVMPTFHPAYLLRNPSGKRLVWDDLKKVMKELAS